MVCCSIECEIIDSRANKAIWIKIGIPGGSLENNAKKPPKSKNK
jgi:hypothetical protein